MTMQGTTPWDVIGPSPTKCPRMGIWQWTCSYDECTCHLRSTIKTIRPITQDGYSWVEIPDHLWKTKRLVEVIDGWGMEPFLNNERDFKE